MHTLKIPTQTNQNHLKKWHAYKRKLYSNTIYSFLVVIIITSQDTTEVTAIQSRVKVKRCTEMFQLLSFKSIKKEDQMLKHM